jgi:hypothetical protein
MVSSKKFSKTKYFHCKIKVEKLPQAVNFLHIRISKIHYTTTKSQHRDGHSTNAIPFAPCLPHFREINLTLSSFYSLVFQGPDDTVL